MASKIQTATNPNYDRTSELKAFDETKAGVKGLVDAGITHVPSIFILPPEQISSDALNSSESQISIPIIDLDLISSNDPTHSGEMIEKVREASASLGFFQVVNHGISTSVLKEMMDGVIRFHEQDVEVKRKWYTREYKQVIYNSNFDLYQSDAASWRNTLYSPMFPNSPLPEELPEPCRDIMIEYSKQVKELGGSLFQLISKALGLHPNHLTDIGCADGLEMLCHYYPACPQPQLTMGTAKHADGDFLTVLLQDHIGGLQILHQNSWINVPSLPGSLVVNIGDLLQLVSNDKMKSIEQRVLANHVGPRVSIACFFTTGMSPSSRIYGPIKDLISEESPSKYREIMVKDYTTYYSIKGLDGTLTLSKFKL